MKLLGWALCSVLLHAVLIWLLPGFKARTLSPGEALSVVLALPSQPAPVQTQAQMPAPAPVKPASAKRAQPQAGKRVAAAPPAVLSLPLAADTAPELSRGTAQVNAPQAPNPPGDVGKNDAVPALRSHQAASFNAAYLRNPQPQMPLISRQRGETGRVVLRVLVSAQGLPIRVDVAKSSGFAALDQAAKTTVAEQWRFEPARRGEQAVDDEVEVPIRFNLEK